MHRIVFVTRPFDFGGTEKHVADLIERLDPAKFEVVVLTSGMDPYSARLGVGCGPKVEVLTAPEGGRFAETWRTFRSLRPRTVVFVNGEFQLFHWRMYLAARLSGARRVVAIEHLIATPPAASSLRHGLDERKGQPLWRWLTWPLRRGLTTKLPGLLSHTTICVSDAVRNRLVHDYGYPSEKTITRRNGVDVSHFARDAETWKVPSILEGRRGPIAVCIALLVPVKRLDVLIHAMKRVAARFPGSCCVILGRGLLEEQLRSLVRELGMEEHVLFAGHTSDVRPYLAAADVFVLPSEREGLPLSLLEATAFGLPSVVSEAGGNAEVVQNGVNGYVVPSGSVEALAEAIESLFGDQKARVQMGKNARRVVEEKFEIDSCMASVRSAILGVA